MTNALWNTPAGRRFRRNRGALVGLGLVLGLALLALLAPLLADRPPDAQSLRDRLEPPSAAHPFGTDEFGRSVYSRVLYSARVSLLTGLVLREFELLYTIDYRAPVDEAVAATLGPEGGVRPIRPGTVLDTLGDAPIVADPGGGEPPEPCREL